MEKKFIFTFLILFLIISLNSIIVESHAQTSSQKSVCPSGTTPKVVGVDIQCISNNISLNCPAGYYVGLDNSGKSACRNIETNQIMGTEKSTSVSTNSKQQESKTQSSYNTIQNTDEVSPYLWIPIIILFFIFIVFFGVASVGKSGKRRYGKRRNFSYDIRQEVLRQQRYRCNDCGVPFERINSKIGYLCDFDHIHRRTSNAIENCQALCPNCHARKTREG